MYRYTPLHVAICDDARCDSDRLAKLIMESGFPAKIFLFTNSEDLLADYELGKYDLIFMDIYLQNMSGIEAVARIRRVDEDTVIAVTTSSIEHALESYRLAVFKYVEKPVTQKDVAAVLSLACLKRKESASLDLLITRKHQSIPLNKILYFEQKKHLVQINMFSEFYHTDLKLTDLIPKLPNPPFFRCHQSYIANLHYVRSLDRDLHIFIMKNGENVYIRRESFKNAKVAFENYLFEEIRNHGQI